MKHVRGRYGVVVALGVAAALPFAAPAPLASAAPAAAAAPAAPGAVQRPWLDTGQPPGARADELLARMTLDEKLAMLHGTPHSGYVGYLPANARLGIPALKLEDGPAGVGDGMHDVTQLPAPVAATASWDPAVMREYGAVIGAEQWAKGANVDLGPTVNIVRDPRWGRAFESTGEDPYLAARMGDADIGGVQSQGVLAQVKHYAVYNQETFRNTPADDALLDERTLREIYLPQFRSAVQDAGASSVMCSYSTVNGSPACENAELLNRVLKEQWGYEGFVTSDWGATHSTLASVDSGLDMEMPAGAFYGLPLKAAVMTGQVSMATVDDHVRRILTEMFRFGLFDRAQTGTPSSVGTTAEHVAAARSIAEQGTVLLKNDGGVLPLDTAKVRSIAVIGPDGSDQARTAGGGSAAVTAERIVTPLEGIMTRAAAGGTQVTYTPGPSEDAARAAAAADVAVVFASDRESEGADRTGLALPGRQDRLIEAVAEANPRTVVVLNTGAPVLMPWVDRVPGLIEDWYPGQEDGAALAAVLFGDADPGGRLPVTFPRSEEDLPTGSAAQSPGIEGGVLYSEGLEVGYRWYDARGIAPLFPFGYGLSYTSFRFSNLAVRQGSDGSAVVTAEVTNTGERSGSAVAELYVGDPVGAGEPPRQLKAFQKAELGPGQTAHLVFPLGRDAFSQWDAATHGWVVTPGQYRIDLGDSSRSIRLTATVTEVARSASRCLGARGTARVTLQSAAGGNGDLGCNPMSVPERGALDG